MTDTAIKIDHLSKKYLITERSPKYRTLRDTFMDLIRSPYKRLSGQEKGHQEAVWALDDVSFAVERGSVVGLIGHNGAGKSTLLKILSRITSPTKGSVDIFGRVGCLLEVGTGFHNELTGRENIYLNGAILGMSRGTIDRKFDEIVDFAEVSRFIDTPVKYYSSGMYLRLAFAVAAHLDTDILLMDEVLAVGDSAFQKKCLGKMGRVAQEGRTVIFVSHDMTNISVLCQQAVWLDQGQLMRIGRPNEVIKEYLSSHQMTEQYGVERNFGFEDAGSGGNYAQLQKVSLGYGPNRIASTNIPLTEKIVVGIAFQKLKDEKRINPVIRIKNDRGMIVFTSANYEDKRFGRGIYDIGDYALECEIPGHILNDGAYQLDILLVREMRELEAEVNQALSFDVFDNGDTRGDYVGEVVGIVRPRCTWSGKRLDSSH
jgi:lipopolysaccharide transport system ATP-binding protein